jgi:ubiquinone/menaquinone biosynthesis C-methylase UbiE
VQVKGNVAGSTQAVRDYWQAQPCGTSLSQAERGSKEFFDEIEGARYQLEPFIPGFADFARWRGCRVLEIGVGLGTDFVRFARAGALLTGIDLTDASVSLVRQRLELEYLQADVLVADAEELPFPNESFDLVYSWGALHHTPDTQRSIDEVHRVLKSSGETRVMLSSRRSWVAFAVWARHAVRCGRPWHSIAHALARNMESPGTRAYTQPELQTLFRHFRSATFSRFVTPYDRRVAGPLADLLGSRLGWFVGAIASR